MAKVTGPLMSLDASGTVAKTATFSKWKGRNYVRVRVTPLNPKSATQAVVRTKLGALGQALSAVLTRFKDVLDVGSQFWADAVAGAPAGQSWISWAMRTILGTNFGAYDAALTAYTAVSAPNKTEYETAAAAAGLTSFSLAYGTAPAVAAGFQLYLLVKFATEMLGYSLSAGTLGDSDPGGLSDFVDYATISIP